ncbi:MAG: hypothetical protein V2A63_00175, partial [Patescibacteria group bacterium]
GSPCSSSDLPGPSPTKRISASGLPLPGTVFVRCSQSRQARQSAISAAHGMPKRRKDGRIFLPLYHPAAALYSPSQRAVHLADFAKIPKILEQIKNAPEPPAPPLEQKKLF